VSEYLEVKPVSRRRLSGLSSPEIIDLVAELAETMQAVHDKGLAHGNLKPSNILVRRMGGPPEVMIADFGITYVYNPEVLTPERAVRAFSYLAPERMKQVVSAARAADARPTPAMDVYSLSVSLAEILTGTMPYVGAETVEELLDKKARKSYIIIGVTNPVRRVDLARLNDVVARGSAADPRDRFASMRELAQALRDCILDGERMAG
jgi:serine/threonine protein kinase